MQPRRERDEIAPPYFEQVASYETRPIVFEFGLGRCRPSALDPKDTIIGVREERGAVCVAGAFGGIGGPWDQAGLWTAAARISSRLAEAPR